MTDKRLNADDKVVSVDGLLLVEQLFVSRESSLCHGCYFDNLLGCPHNEPAPGLEFQPCYDRTKDFIWIEDSNEGRAAYIARKLSQ